MTEETATIIYIISLSILLLIVILAQIMSAARLKQKAGLITNLIVVAPFIITFIYFLFSGNFGRYNSVTPARIAGTLLSSLGVTGYTISILYLRKNWSFSASIREGHELVKSGPYKYVRHPIYFSLLLVFIGSGLLIENYLILLCTPVVCFVYYLRARREEQLLKAEFPEYSKYAKETKMLIPGLF